MSDVIIFLIGPISGLVAAISFYWLLRRENIKTAAIVEQMEENFHNQVEEQIQRIQRTQSEYRASPLPEIIDEQARATR